MAEDEQRTKSSCPTSNLCPICLGPLHEAQESYLDQCFHKFCYNCIVHWTKVVASKNSHPPSSIKCPLCKTENFSIIHEYDGNSFQRHYVNQDFANSAFFSKAHKYRLQCYYIEPVTLIDKFKISRYWKSRKYLQPNQWLQSWLRREIQALIQNALAKASAEDGSCLLYKEEDVEIIVHHIHGVIDSLRRNEQNASHTFETIRENFKALVSEAAGRFLTGRTNRFVNEVEMFLASGLTIEAYDKVYMQHLGWKLPGVPADDVEEEEEEEFERHAPLVPCLYFFDEDSDGAE